MTERLSLMALICGLGGALAAAADRPNILLVYTDDHSHRTVGCYPESHDWVRTPHIDRLAAEGMRFTHAYIGTWCMPSRATVLTGRLPHGVASMRMVGKYPGSEYDPGQCRFWPSVFRERGYTTAQIGKWHTGVDAGWGRDWDHQKVWNRPRHPDNAFNYYFQQLVSTNGGKPEMTRGYATDNYTDWAEAYIRGEGRDRRKPWFLWLCYGAVHGPFTPAERHLDSHEGVRVTAPADIYERDATKPKYVRDMDKWRRGEDGRPRLKGNRRGVHGPTLSDWVRQYQEGVLAIDEGLGRVLAALEESGQAGNTLVVFTSDQGYAWGQHGFNSKLAPYDATIRSPFIVRWPGVVPAGSVCRSPVGGQDLAPTFFGAAGLDPPWDMHGHDLGPLLRDPGATWKHPVLMTLTGRRYGADTDTIPATFEEQQVGGVPWWVSLTRGRTKYIRTLLPGEIEELYDLENDPAELRNLALEPEYRSVLVAFRDAAVNELRRTGAGFAESLPPTGTDKAAAARPSAP